MMKVGVTGGIGSGKSTVCRLFVQKGVAVYDSDGAAKRLIAGPLRPQVEARFGTAVYHEDALDRRKLAGIVFSDDRALADLNAIVHPAVLEDFRAWTERQEGDYVILESAILFESGFDKAVDQVLAVLAPAEVRIERTCRRDGVCESEVLRRMAAQMNDDELHARADFTVVNLYEKDLEPAVAFLDRTFRQNAKRY